MCGSVEYGKCEICGKETTLNRTYFHYGFMCDCHNKDHFDFVRHCKDCVPKPPERTKVMFTREQALRLGDMERGDPTRRESMRAYGDYETFDHEPTEAEVKNAAENIILNMADTIMERGMIRKHYNECDPLGMGWMVGIRIYMPGPAKRNVSGSSQRVEHRRIELGEDGRMKVVTVTDTSEKQSTNIYK